MTLDTMLLLLRFAYLESMGFWIVPYALAGLFFTSMAGIKLKGRLRLPCVAFVLAAFFSLALAVGRTAVPVPTLFAFGWWAADAVRHVVHPPPCQPSSEGCMSPDDGDLWIVLPLLVQWLSLYLLLAAASHGWRAFARARSKQARNSARSPRA